MATRKKTSASNAAIGGAYPTMTAEDTKRMERYQAEDDLRTLARAIEIRKDPRRLASARAIAQEQIKAAQATAAAIK